MPELDFVRRLAVLTGPLLPPLFGRLGVFSAPLFSRTLKEVEATMTEQPPGGYPPPPPPQGGGYPPPPGGQPAQPSNYLAWSILSTLFCCLPLGVVAIVKSSQVNGLWAQGKYAEAQQSSDAAKKWALWSTIIGLVVLVIYGILYATGSIAIDTGTTS